MRETRRISPIQTWARALANIAPLQHQTALTLPVLIDHLAGVHEDRPALQSETCSLSYRGLAQRKNRFAHWAAAHKIGPGDTVCVMMGNCPDYIAMWLGISQTGAAVALINTTLRGAALVQAIACCKPGHLVTDAGNLAALLVLRAEMISDPVCWVVNGDGPQALDPARYGADEAACVAMAADTALLVYTSGTTGLPKAAKISHYRVLEWSYWFAGMMDTGPADRLYDCLPLYHSTGGIAGVGGLLVQGGTVVLRERFSARSFWQDVAASGCTIFLYIGELCRYLLAAPPHPSDGAHGLRLCCGNGLRAEIWEAFQARFAVPQILEFYAATEGNVSLYNVEARPGAVGRVPAILRPRFPLALIAVDHDTGEILRKADGTCVACAPGDAGEAIGRIFSSGNTAPDSFEGYTDTDATERKILRGVFKSGDAWFRTGDLMRQDEAGFFYFVDRLGDTFRWKGENVSASQVSGALCRYPCISGAVVYGVAVPGEDGRAGMAAVTTQDGFDLAGLHDFLAANLPPFALPLFLRICSEIETTATFKTVKTRLAAEGYDRAIVADPIFKLDRPARRYKAWGDEPFPADAPSYLQED